jgi:hypothetical protein
MERGTEFGEVPMRETRRRFAIGLVAGIFLTAGAELLFAQRHRPIRLPQQPDHPPVLGIGDNAAQLDPKGAKAAMLLQNEKEFREGVEQLYVLVNELKEEVEKTATADVLSVRMYKKAHEIEKLAKQIKSKVKG